MLTCLIGELWRRIGDERAAALWFDRVWLEITDPDERQWIVEATDRQRRDPQEWFS